jgi:transposase-like protein
VPANLRVDAVVSRTLGTDTDTNTDDLKNSGVKDSFFLVCDGLKGLPEVVGNVLPLTTEQTCTIHLIRNTFRLAPNGTSNRSTRPLRLQRPRLR